MIRARNNNDWTRFFHRLTRIYAVRVIIFFFFAIIAVSFLMFIFSDTDLDPNQAGNIFDENADMNDKFFDQNDKQNDIFNDNINNNQENNNDYNLNNNQENNQYDFNYNLDDQKKSEEEDKKNKCEICKNLPKAYGNSSPKDLIITGVFGKEKKFKKFIRSLRSTGCKAKVVVVSNVSLKQDYQDMYKKCNVDFFVMKSPPETMSMYPHSLRYVGYQQYFNQLKNQTFNRVLHADSFDVFFQKDPFTDDIRNDRLYFTMEDILIQNSSWNSGWLTRAYNESTAISLANYPVSCSGTLIGGYSQFLKYLKVLLNHPPFWANGRHSLDQAYHNYLLHTSAFKKAGIKEEFMGCNSPIITMHYCGRIKQVVKNGRIYTPNGKIIPSIVHQYPLYQSMSDAISKMCPKL